MVRSNTRRCNKVWKQSKRRWDRWCVVVETKPLVWRMGPGRLGTCGRLRRPGRLAMSLGRPGAAVSTSHDWLIHWQAARDEMQLGVPATRTQGFLKPRLSFESRPADAPCLDRVIRAAGHWLPAQQTSANCMNCWDVDCTPDCNNKRRAMRVVVGTGHEDGGCEAHHQAILISCVRPLSAAVAQETQRGQAWC
jgi:hypothetical protein